MGAKRCVFLILLFLSLAFIRLDRCFFKQNDSFSPGCILPTWSRCPQLTTLLPDDIKQILNQPFTYLTKGKQSFVFVSKDQKWVLKYFRLPRYVKRHSFKGTKSRIPFLHKTFQSFKWAQETLSQETQVVYAHLQPTCFLKQLVTLVDLFGRQYSMNLDDLPFVIQKKGSLFFPYFAKVDQSEARLVIEETLLLFKKMHQKGFIDRDPIFDKNFGIQESHPFILDIGQLEKCDSLPPLKNYLLEMTHSLESYLSREDPELYAYYLEYINNL